MIPSFYGAPKGAENYAKKKKKKKMQKKQTNKKRCREPEYWPAPAGLFLGVYTCT